MTARRCADIPPPQAPVHRGFFFAPPQFASARIPCHTAYMPAYSGAVGIINDFLDGELVFVRSSNVVAAQWNEAAGTLMIEFKKGVAWVYAPVDRREARAFIEAPSHGIWVWDNLKKRGTRHDHLAGVRAAKLR